MGPPPWFSWKSPASSLLLSAPLACNGNLFFCIPCATSGHINPPVGRVAIEFDYAEMYVLVGMRPLLSPRLPLSRASVPSKGGVPGADSKAGGGWVGNKRWKPYEGVQALNEEIPLKLKTSARWRLDLGDFDSCIVLRGGISISKEIRRPGS